VPSELEKLWFSQAALSAWQNCPLKFKYRYIDGLYWPLAVEGQVSEHIEMGRKFHLLAQRHFSCGGTGPVPGEPLLASWLAQLQENFPLNESEEYLPEYELRSAKNGLRLLAKYDLLAVAQDKVTIYDWKTDERPPRAVLAASPQSRLYLYLLSSSGFFQGEPEQVAMVYWNPRFPQEPLRVSYSARQRQEDGEWLRRLIAEILSTSAFPITSNEKNCRYCEYRPVCHGQGLEEIQEDLLELEEVDWEQIQEIALQGVNLP